MATFAEMIPHLIAGKVVKRDEFSSGSIAYGWALTGPDGKEPSLRMVRYFKDRFYSDEYLTHEDIAADDWEVTDWGKWDDHVCPECEAVGNHHMGCSRGKPAEGAR